MNPRASLSVLARTQNFIQLTMSALRTASRRLIHFWHTVSNIRPIFWLGLYLCLVPAFALIYNWLPDGQFRVPDGGSTNYCDWLYYSIVTITTLGFGDYTPAHSAAQWVTAVEVLLGLITIGFFLNAVGSMKSEIDVESEIDKQRRVHVAGEREKLIKNTPVLLHKINLFLDYCYAVTTPLSKRDEKDIYSDDFTADDMLDMHRPSGLISDLSTRSAIRSLVKATDSLSLFLDSLQQRVDLSIWPDLLEDCFAFVANFQMLSEIDKFRAPDEELVNFIRTNARLARSIETCLTKIETAPAE